MGVSVFIHVPVFADSIPGNLVVSDNICESGDLYGVLLEHYCPHNLSSPSSGGVQPSDCLWEHLFGS